jgi:hypothetical protein
MEWWIKKGMKTVQDLLSFCFMLVCECVGLSGLLPTRLSWKYASFLANAWPRALPQKEWDKKKFMDSPCCSFQRNAISFELLIQCTRLTHQSSNLKPESIINVQARRDKTKLTKDLCEQMGHNQRPAFRYLAAVNLLHSTPAVNNENEERRKK